MNQSTYAAVSAETWAALRHGRRGLISSVLYKLLGKDLHTLSAGQLTYDLRRLRAHGLITRRAGTHRYRVTDTGLNHALFLTRAHQRLLRTGLARLTDPVPSPLRSASRAYPG